jgi:hypothetical protein
MKCSTTQKFTTATKVVTLDYNDLKDKKNLQEEIEEAYGK